MQFDPEIEELLSQYADIFRVDVAALKAVVEVEGASVDLSDGAQDGLVNGLVIIRWEGHYFWRHLPERSKALAEVAGLASPRAGAVRNPRTMEGRHQLLQRAMALNEDAALMSISMGVGQVMGAHWSALGYPSVQNMWAEAQTLPGQVEMMMRFIRSNNLVRHLQSLDWAAFARAYNGPGYRRNQYDTRLDLSYVSHGGTRSLAIQETNVLRIGDTREHRVRALQERLVALGYRTDIDGDFGPETRRAVQIFQADQSLDPDGIVGPQTQNALDTAIPQTPDTSRVSASEGEVADRSRIASNGRTIRDTATVGAAATTGIGAVAESGVLDDVEAAGRIGNTISQATRPIEPLLQFAQEYWWLLAGVGLAILAILAARIVRARVEDHRSGKTV